MDYRMYDKGAPAGKNVVELIAQRLREQGPQLEVRDARLRQRPHGQCSRFRSQQAFCA